MECYQQSQIATKEPPKPVGSGMGGFPPNFFPWRDSEGNAISSVGQVRPQRFRHPHGAYLARYRLSCLSRTFLWVIERSMPI